TVEASAQCADVSVPKCFTVTAVPVICIERTLAGGSVQLESYVTGNNTSYTTVYVLTNDFGTIQQVNTVNGSFNVSTAGTYHIYAINYSGTAPSYGPGNNINSVIALEGA